jgi:hypothetical protein
MVALEKDLEKQDAKLTTDSKAALAMHLKT